MASSVRTISGPEDPRSDALVAALAADAWGVVSLAELRACGLSAQEVKVRVRRGLLHRVHHGVYAVGHAGLTQEGRWLAAVKACGPDAVPSHTSSAMLFGFLPREDRRTDVTVFEGRRRAPAGLRAHRTRSLHAEDIWRHDGIRTTSPARTLLDLAATFPDLPLRRAMSRAQSMRLTNHRLLARQLDRAAGRPGRARYARVVASRPPATRSELEDRVFDLVVAGGFARPDVNVPLYLDGRRVVPDLRWPQQRLIVEADSAQWHDTPQARADDAERQGLLEAHGERVIRVTWAQATAHVAQMRARIGAARAPRPGARP
jgi:hypothetical protein